MNIYLEVTQEYRRKCTTRDIGRRANSGGQVFHSSTTFRHCGIRDWSLILLGEGVEDI